VVDSVLDPVQRPTPAGVDVLIVEDKAASRQSLHELLAARFPSLRFAETADGEDALGQFVLLHPLLVIVDIHLPRMSGLELARQVKALDANTSLCIITGHDLPGYRDAAVRLGADHFLVKGAFAAEELLDIVEGFLSKHRRLLIADASHAFRRILTGWVSQQWPSMAVVEADDGPQALQLAQTLMPDLVLLAVRLPTANGFEVARALKALHPESTTVLVGACDLPEYQEAAIRCGATCFIARDSITCADLVLLVRSALFGSPPH